MKRTATLIVAGALGLGGLALTLAAATAAEAPVASAATEVIDGMIDQVNLTANEFVLAVPKKPSGAADEEKITIKINDKTAFTLDGKGSNKADALKAGRDASVSHEERVALRVDVRSKKDN